MDISLYVKLEALHVKEFEDEENVGNNFKICETTTILNRLYIQCTVKRNIIRAFG